MLITHHRGMKVLNKVLNKQHSSSEGNGGHREDHEHAPAACGEVPAQDCQSGRVSNIMKVITQVSLKLWFLLQSAPELLAPYWK